MLYVRVNVATGVEVFEVSVGDSLTPIFMTQCHMALQYFLDNYSL